MHSCILILFLFVGPFTVCIAGVHLLATPARQAPTRRARTVIGAGLASIGVVLIACLLVPHAPPRDPYSDEPFAPRPTWVAWASALPLLSTLSLFPVGVCAAGAHFVTRGFGRAAPPARGRSAPTRPKRRGPWIASPTLIVLGGILLALGVAMVSVVVVLATVLAK